MIKIRREYPNKKKAQILLHLLNTPVAVTDDIELVRDCLRLRNAAIGHQPTVLREELSKSISERLAGIRLQLYVNLLSAPRQEPRLMSWLGYPFAIPTLGNDGVGRTPLEILMDAIKDGSIDKIKKCVSDGCPKWFFAHSVAKKYCTGNCRMKAAHARPEYNEYQRAQQLFLYYFNSPKYGPHHPETEAKRRLVEKVKAQHARRKRRR